MLKINSKIKLKLSLFNKLIFLVKVTNSKIRIKMTLNMADQKVNIQTLILSLNKIFKLIMSK